MLNKDIIWAPWRMKYILDNKKENKCPFCILNDKQEDEKRFILYRSKYCFVIMNIYPYNNGHLMIVPYKHINDITLLKNEEQLDIFNTLNKTINILKTALKPEGFNIGINLGKVAGAGISQHIHIHIVPRWLGDANYIPVISDTKIINQSLQETYKYLKSYYDKI